MNRKQQYIAIIERILIENDPGHQDAHLKLAWQRGFLTSVLAALADNDSLVGSDLYRRTSEYKSQKK